jgi:predicted site-specific integrase-resolvase
VTWSGKSQELVWDMLAIVTGFADRLYGQRSAKTRRLCMAVVGEVGRDAA